MKHLVLSTTVWDSIHFPDNRVPVETIGGAGIYALAGMKVWDDDIGIVTGVGEDYLARFGPWYVQNHISTAGLMVKDPLTPHTIIQYDVDGERVETPEYGLEHYGKMEAAPSELECHLGGTEGVYVFKNSSAVFWEELLGIKQRRGFRILWEIAADSAVYGNLDAVLRIARQTDMFSINRTEAIALLGVHTFEEAMMELQRSRIPLVYLRNGADGTYLIEGKRICHVPSVKNIQVVDATGGGNSSSGAALIGLCRKCPLEKIGAMGNAASSFCIEQFGIPMVMGERLRDEAHTRMRGILKSMGQGFQDVE